MMTTITITPRQYPTPMPPSAFRICRDIINKIGASEGKPGETAQIAVEGFPKEIRDVIDILLLSAYLRAMSGTGEVQARLARANAGTAGGIRMPTHRSGGNQDDLAPSVDKTMLMDLGELGKVCISKNYSENRVMLELPYIPSLRQAFATQMQKAITENNAVYTKKNLPLADGKNHKKYRVFSYSNEQEAGLGQAISTKLAMVHGFGHTDDLVFYVPDFQLAGQRLPRVFLLDDAYQKIRTREKLNDLPGH